MRFVLIFLWVVTVFLSGCTFKSERQSVPTVKNPIQYVEVKDSIFLNVPFKPNFKYVNYSKMYNENVILIAEPLTIKKILLFDLQGKALDTLDISAVVTRLNANFNNISVFSSDSILFYTFHQIIFSNIAGKIYNIINVKNIFPDSIYVFYNMAQKNFNLGSSSFLISGVLCLGDKKKYKDSVYFKMFNKSGLAVISKSGRFIKKIVYLPWFNDKPFYALGHGNFKVCHDGYILLWMRYSNKVIMVDTVNFQPIKNFYIRSKVVETNAPMLPADYKGETTNYLAIHGGIIDITYNKRNEKYYVIVQDSIPGLNMKNKEKRRYALIIYDKNLNKIEEKIIPASKYAPYSHFVTDRGIWIQRKYDYDKKKLIFDLVH